ncbi:hypothetical protein [Phyllobacterium sp. P5_D12]
MPRNSRILCSRFHHFVCHADSFTTNGGPAIKKTLLNYNKPFAVGYLKNYDNAKFDDTTGVGENPIATRELSTLVVDQFEQEPGRKAAAREGHRGCRTGSRRQHHLLRQLTGNRHLPGAVAFSQILFNGQHIDAA